MGTELGRALGSRGIVLHDRKMPGGRANIDHLVVAPSGVWVVDAKEYRGRVERRDVGGWFRSDVRLYVGRRDRSKALEGVQRQQEAVRRMIEHEFGNASPRLHASVCLVGAKWPWYEPPLSFDGIWVASPRRLASMVLASALLDGRQIERVAELLARHFPVR